MLSHWTINQVYDVSDLAEITPGLETAKVIGSGSGWMLEVWVLVVLVLVL